MTNNHGLVLNRDCRVEKNYFSRRTRVFQVQVKSNKESSARLVVKVHAEASAAELEYNNLMQLSAAGLNVPVPLGLDGRVLYLQHLEGLLLTDILERKLVPRAVWTKALACWCLQLHLRKEAGAMLKTDNNLRNFIFREGAFYGLDFETISRGDPACDLGQLSAYILADRPAFTLFKRTAAAEFISYYLRFNIEISIHRIEEELLLELGRMAERRKDQTAEIKRFTAYLGEMKGLLSPMLKGGSIDTR